MITNAEIIVIDEDALKHLNEMVERSIIASLYKQGVITEEERKKYESTRSQSNRSK